MNITMFRRSSIAGLLIAGLLLSSRDEARAYLPLECGSDSYKDDFKESPLIVIGRVTAIERYRTPDRARPEVPRPFYLATITVGRTLGKKAL